MLPSVGQRQLAQILAVQLQNVEHPIGHVVGRPRTAEPVEVDAALVGKHQLAIQCD
jgi:hypothetical protein